MARDGLGPGEVQAVTFGDSAIQPLGAVPSSDSRHPLRARSGNVRARRALVNIRGPAIS